MSTIYLVGLGPGDPQALTLRALKTLKRVKSVYLRTARHPGLQLLTRYQIRYTALDFVYEKSSTFDETYQKIAYLVMNAARKKGPVAYAVPGSPLFAEKAVEIILKKAPAAGIRCRIIPSVSFMEAMAAEICLPRDEEVAVVDALQQDKLLDYPEKHLLIMQAYNSFIASRVKLELGSIYPDDHPVTAIRGAGLFSGKKTVTVPLYKMDRIPFIDHLTTFYLPPVVPRGITDFLRVMRRLRGEEGCPWDREQDHHTLKPYLLEEAYEVLGAINSGSAKDLCEELGDLLLQVVFHCQIASENGTFTFYDAVDGITEKLIRRHPHVFGSASATTAGDVMKSWQQIKKDEKTERTSLFTLENYLPALLRAQKLQRQASSAGFDWPDDKGAWQKVDEELKELIDAYNQQDQAKIVEEFGDLLFAAVNVSRFLKVDAEQALAGSTEKFYKRLRYVEQMAEAEGRGISGYSLSKLDEWWEEAKKQ
ncbi:MAG: nucleoside triphosphate pyrophosphohydrolase [Clostridiales bacterium]|nr:nucleoside triphosphate pyrophosphohydrolase [Clostridiales bacterium]